MGYDPLITIATILGKPQEDGQAGVGNEHE
jgi:hypothetical protein